MFKKKTIRDIELNNKTVLFRVAYDVPLKRRGKNLTVADNQRIDATLPTLKFLLKKRCKIIIMSWLHRPNGKIVETYRMDPVARSLSRIIHQKVKKIDECVGAKVETAVNALRNGEILMLENTRFHPEEQANDPNFARKLTRYADVIVFDAFGQAHRTHASTVGILKIKPSVAGFLVEKEIKALAQILEKPKRPMVIILGGAKISDKFDVIKQLLPRADQILIGGGVANTFLEARGFDVQHSLVESSVVAKNQKRNSLEAARDLLKNRYAHKISLPVDFCAGNRTDSRSKTMIIDVKKGQTLRKNWMFLDIGPKTARAFEKIIQKAGSIIWNGPLGLFEVEKFAQGTKKIALALAKQKHKKILVCGGDTEEIVTRYHVRDHFYHVSTGGGATLQLIAEKKLPAIELLPDKK